MPDVRRILDPFTTVFECSMAKITIQLKKFKKLYLQALFPSQLCLFTLIQCSVNQATIEKLVKALTSKTFDF